MKLTKLQDITAGDTFRTTLTRLLGRVIERAADGEVQVFIEGKGIRHLHPGVLVYADRG
jgi:thiamine biosynthesis protein ThiC